MVDVSAKSPTRREAVAAAFVELNEAVLAALPDGQGIVAAVQHDRTIRRTMIDGIGGVIRIQKAALDTGRRRIRARKIHGPCRAIGKGTDNVRVVRGGSETLDQIVGDQVIAVILCILVPTDLQLLEIVQAGNSDGLRFGAGQRGEQQARENGDDRDDHQ